MSMRVTYVSPPHHRRRRRRWIPTLSRSAAITGTATVGITEADVVAGGKTIVITLTNATWVAAGATFNAQRQNIINGIDSAQSEPTGWDAVVKAGQTVAGVVRTSATVVTITLDAFPTYDITAQETITVTVPASATVEGFPITGSPSFLVNALGVAQYIATSVRIDGVTYVYHTPLHNLQASSAPTTAHGVAVGYAPGSKWIDKTADHVYVCVDGTIGAAVWKQLD